MRRRQNQVATTQSSRAIAMVPATISQESVLIAFQRVRWTAYRSASP